MYISWDEEKNGKKITGTVVFEHGTHSFCFHVATLEAVESTMATTARATGKWQKDEGMLVCTKLQV